MRRPSDDAAAMLHEAVRNSLDAHVAQGAALALGFSGGRDSSVLLDVLAALAASRGHALTAIHIHHGLSANADAWATFCAERCAELGVACVIRRVAVSRQPRTSLEAEARRARYAALAEIARESGAAVVALAHQQDDQAETLLLQLLRGAGPHGLAAMPAVRQDRDVAWWRPLLDVARADIDAYARARNLAWIDDESNADARQAEAAQLEDELAQHDAAGAVEAGGLRRDALVHLAPHRARNLLRWYLRSQGLPAPSSARLAAMLGQLRASRSDSAIRLLHAGVEIGVHRGRIALHAPAPSPFDAPWHGESLLSLPHGTLVFGHAEGAGLDQKLVASTSVRVRSRAGGERLQLASDRPRRALKSILRDAGIPAWERAGLPLIFCGDALAAVAGVGVDTAFRAQPGQPGVTIAWNPRAR
jgi:tRNA(Ile)-lysidine synthase